MSTEQPFLIFNKERKNDVLKTIQLAFQATELTESLFPIIKLNKGGEFEVESPEGKERYQEFNGVIVHHRNSRAYWPGEFKGGGEPPQCSSLDAITGHGDPGGDCETCELAKWGSADDGVGQACRKSRSLYILREDSILPYVLRLSPGQLQTHDKYMSHLLAQLGRWDWIITKLKVFDATSGRGLKYFSISYLKVRDLNEDEKAIMTPYTEQFLSKIHVPRQLEAQS